MNWQPGEMLKTLHTSAHDLHDIPDESVHLIVTSPPYLNLRAYAGDQAVDWPEVVYRPMPVMPEIVIPGCKPDCEHEWVTSLTKERGGEKSSEMLQTKGKENFQIVPPQEQAHCSRCGGWRGALGSEPTIEAYIGHLVLCLREWWRVLRRDGTCVVNLGDTYAANRSYQIKRTKQIEGSQLGHGSKVFPGLKAKDLCLVPERFALAAQAEGWWVRSKPPWIKRNAMPDSTSDRPSPSHESIWMLAKSETYYWDMDSIKQPVSEGSKKRLNQATFDTQTDGEEDYRNGTNPNRSARTALENGAGKAEGGRFLRTSDFMFWSMQLILDGNEGMVIDDDGEPLALVVNPRGYSKSHFAVFPPQLVEPFVRAGTSVAGCCPTCSAPWQRVVRKPDMEERPTRSTDAKTATDEIHVSNGWAGHPKSAGQAYQEWRNANPDVTVGWCPTCTCIQDACPDVDMTGADWMALIKTTAQQFAPIPCIVLDPFAGSGTTGKVALENNRRAVLGDKSREYLEEHVRDRTTVQMALVVA